MTGTSHAEVLRRPAPQLRLFDAYTVVGYGNRPPLAPALTPADLLAEMDRCGVDEALVHTAGETASPLVTNEQVTEFCRSSSRLHPVWSVLPPQTGEMEPKQLFLGMRQHRVRALAAWPDEHRYILNGLTMGAILEPMLERRIPLFVRGGGALWERITHLLEEFPALVVVACEYGCWGQDRYIRPLMDHFEHFYIETSNLELDGGIPSLVRRYGGGRILFGSAYHRRPMGGSSLLLRNLDIDDKDKTLIGHGNLERLLKEARL